ncbi:MULTISPECIES: acyl-CoA dehydrogenase family protein [unclassified Exiguobacterium]|uniref:acyl-CoA dehydrogenase family protein n=1 Tax=unclassified Exiguobacterium TaxID=2644629 RepID=UPI0008D5B4B0|nr:MULTISPECIES: acyl-CoA dehydrogenase family protein [unclassified Exiguobacterium]OGX79982.1 acyl-CoA dehydrogenase [Exiguobacterium sp. SH31]TCI39367.1 acyl-CoA dehydrogenase [Exiguobacterium sp. SH4S7]TCI64912.1 acyl-CoA dehydrogenase [Exiguobacterium sp. SH3S1]TCI73352.1 acyl-CoA dehydrogenase [Exiguobacterium sp. SH0S7]
MERTEHELIKGGSFVIDALDADRLFTPEDFSDEHKMIGDTTSSFVDDRVMPVLGRIEKHEFDLSVELLKEAGELGLLGADVPEEYGGYQLDKISSSIITERFAKARSFALSYGAHVGIGTLPIVFFGTEEQKHKYLPKLATGEWIAAYALTEPGSGSDALGAKSTAVLNEAGTHYVLNGEKQWITNAGFANVFVVYAKIDGDKFSAFIVERDYNGVSTGAEEQKMGIKGSSTRTLILQDVEVPVDNLLGEVGKGHVIAFNILNVGRYKLAVGAVGSSKRAFDLSVQYANERKQFKTPISQFPLIQEKLATMAANIYAMESSVYRTGGLFQDSLDALGDENMRDGSKVAQSIAEYAIECSLNKVFASETFDYVVDEAVQIHGGYGFMTEYEVENLYRDSRINRIFEGTNEINRLIVPSTLLKKAMKGDLPLLAEAQKLQKELMSYMPQELDGSPLAREKMLLSNMKKINLMIAGTAVQKYQQNLQNEQEILAKIADIISAIYALEAAIARTDKAIARTGIDKNQQKVRYTEIFAEQVFKQVELMAKEVLYAAASGDEQRMLLSAMKKFSRYQPINVIGTKREVAASLIKANKFIV